MRTAPRKGADKPSTDKERLDAALDDLARKENALVGKGEAHCAECGWHQFGRGGNRLRAFYDAQSAKEAFGDGEMLIGVLGIQHLGPADKIVEALQRRGLNAEWDGDITKSVMVKPMFFGNA